MEKYKKTLKLRMILLGIMVLLAVALSVFNVFFATQDMKNSYIFGFQCGFATGGGIYALYLLIKYGKLIKDEKKLRLEYNKENDERTKAVLAKAGLPMILYTSVAMIFAGVFAGYFNLAVMKALVFAAMAQLVISIIVKLIYNKLM